MHAMAEIGQIALAVTEGREMFARCALLGHADMNQARWIESAHDLVEDRRDVRGVDEVRQLDRGRQALAPFRGLDAGSCLIDEMLGYGVLDDDIAVVEELALLLQREFG